MLFLKGSLIGFFVALPVGPVGVLCIQHSLRRGLLAGVIAGLGAALADAVYGGMAGFGVSIFSHVITQYEVWFQMIGTLVLWSLGFKILKTQPKEIQTTESSFSYSGIFFSTFGLTLTNPLTLICFAACYASFGVTPPEDEFLPAALLILGVFFGAALWWLLLSFGVSKIGKKFDIQSSPLLNRISGGFLTGCGCLTGLSVLKQLLFFA